MDETYGENLARMCAAHLTFQSGLLAAREMYGKSYFALGVGEKVAVDRTVSEMTAGNYQALTVENLAGLSPSSQPKPTVGFVDHTARPPEPVPSAAEPPANPEQK